MTRDSELFASRRLVAIAYCSASVVIALCASVQERPLALVPSLALLIAAWLALQTAYESGALATDSAVREACKKPLGSFGHPSIRILLGSLSLTALLWVLVASPLRSPILAAVRMGASSIAARAHGHSVWHHFQAGGWAMWLILFWLICSISVIAERMVYLFGASINKDVFLATVQKCILAGDIARAVKMCSAANAPLARIVQSGLVKVNRPDEEVQAAMDEAALREMPKISRRTGLLALFSNLAMLCGLSGTVVGLIKAFSAVSGKSVDPSQKSRILAEGIAEAMNCTAFGLLAAIVALCGFAFLNGKTRAMEDEFDEASVQVLNLVVANRERVNLQGMEG